MIDYSRNPQPYILLGDSRMGELPAKEIADLTGKPYVNMAYGGGTLNEVVDTFWLADRLTKLKEVWIGLGFHLYNDYNYTTRTEAYLAIEKNPLLYFTNRTVVESTWYNVRYAYTGASGSLNDPTVTREQLWKQYLGPLTTKWYERYVYPKVYRKQLTDIAAYCRKKGIRLGFIIFPTYVDVQMRVGDFGLDRYYQQFKTDVSELGPTYDFDYPNEITTDKDSFVDPYHFTKQVADEIIHQVWADAPFVGMRLSPP